MAATMLVMDWSTVTFSGITLKRVTGVNTMNTDLISVVMTVEIAKELLSTMIGRTVPSEAVEKAVSKALADGLALQKTGESSSPSVKPAETIILGC